MNGLNSLTRWSLQDGYQNIGRIKLTWIQFTGILILIFEYSVYFATLDQSSKSGIQTPETGKQVSQTDVPEGRKLISFFNRLLKWKR